jgi:hypothetical protein
MEQKVLDRLNRTGWPASPFGQALLPTSCSQGLLSFKDRAQRPSRLRWLPDIVTVRTWSDGESHVTLIDVKTGNGPNYAIEVSALETVEVIIRHLFTPTVFVFNDWNVLTPQQVREYGFPGHYKGNGSGTPFRLVEKYHGRPFDLYFPPAI